MYRITNIHSYKPGVFRPLYMTGPWRSVIIITVYSAFDSVLSNGEAYRMVGGMRYLPNP